MSLQCDIIEETSCADSLINEEKERADMEKTKVDGNPNATLLDDESAPPEGGFGWVIVIVAFSVQFLLLGTINNFAILYIKLMEEFNSDKQETSWVGSITYGIMFLSGPIATSLCEKMGCRPVAVMGGLIAAIATFLASFSTSILKLYLTEGFLFGVGASLCYFPSMLILPQYFRKKWSLVTGFVTCGSGVGTMALGPGLNNLTKLLGWRKTLRITSCSMIVVALISFIYRPRVTKKTSSNDELQKRPMFDFSVLKNKAYLAFVVALFVFMLSYQVPFVHLMPMAIEYGVPIDKAALLAGIISIFSTVGRLLFGHVADSPRINRLYMYQIAFLGIGVANTLCTILKTFYGLIAYCALFGFFEGCYVCQVPILTGDIVGPESMGSGVGILFGIKSIPLTLGPPIAGALYNVSSSYELAFYVAGALSIVTACIMFAIPFLMPRPEDELVYLHQSTSKLIAPPSVESMHNNNEYDNRSKETISHIHLSPASAMAKQRNLKRPSIISAHHLHMDLEKKISMKDIGSLSSFGSMLLSPSSRKNSLAPRPHAHTFDERISMI